jgi:hypothetical protein
MTNLEAQARQVQRLDEGIDEPDRVVPRDPILKGWRK